MSANAQAAAIESMDMSEAPAAGVCEERGVSRSTWKVFGIWTAIFWGGTGVLAESLGDVPGVVRQVGDTVLVDPDEALGLGLGGRRICGLGGASRRHGEQQRQRSLERRCSRLRGGRTTGAVEREHIPLSAIA